MAPTFNQLERTRRTLVERLKNWDDQKSWQDFFQAYWKLIYNAATKAGLSHDEAQDVVQETVVAVTKRIKDLKYDPALGSFRGWLLHTTRWKITDQFRRRLPGQRSSPDEKPANTRDTSTEDGIPDPNFNWDDWWNDEYEKNLMDAALQRIKTQVSPKQWQMFECYALKRWPIKKVTQTLEVSATHVYVANHRITALLKKEIKKLQEELY